MPVINEIQEFTLKNLDTLLFLFYFSAVSEVGGCFENILFRSSFLMLHLRFLVNICVNYREMLYSQPLIELKFMELIAKSVISACPFYLLR